MRYFASLITIVFFAVGQFAQAQTAVSEPATTDQQTVERDAEAGSGSVDIREYEEGAQAITEYRRFGQLYMLKVKPKGAAPPLYMIDQYGDGELNKRPADSIEDDVNLPKWRLGSF
jgi:hypothetical protein